MLGELRRDIPERIQKIAAPLEVYYTKRWGKP
jgi:hypothetical protein